MAETRLTDKDLQRARFVEFIPADAARLAAFHKTVEREVGDLRVFKARDEAFLARHPAAGWTVGLSRGGDIVSTVVLWGDLTAFTKSWYVHHEEAVIPKPAAWWGGWAMSARYRGKGLRPKHYAGAAGFAREKGFASLIGAFFPKSFAAHRADLDSGDCRIVGLYYDEFGWNFLRCNPLGDAPVRPAQGDTELWVGAAHEEGLRAAFSDGMAGVASRKTADGYDVGFARLC